MPNDEHALILVTCGAQDEARVVARALVDSRLAAGVQVMAIESVYRWSGDVVEDQEWLLMVKTRTDRFEQVDQMVRRLHSYEVPPVVMVGIDDASPPYLAWIDRNVG